MTLYAKRAKVPANVRYGDIITGLPIPKGICSGIHCSHVLESFMFGGHAAGIEKHFREFFD
jgi:hypothetical protein